jgi:hypothetical protein
METTSLTQDLINTGIDFLLTNIYDGLADDYSVVDRVNDSTVIVDVDGDEFIISTKSTERQVGTIVYELTDGIQITQI